jgi:hypothetical protein
MKRSTLASAFIFRKGLTKAYGLIFIILVLYFIYRAYHG